MNIKTPAYTAMAASLLLAASASAQSVTTVADFELGREFNNITGFWYYVDDSGNQGNSKIVSGDTSFKPPIWNSESVVAPGNAGSKYAAKLAFTFGDKQLSCGPTCSYPPEVMIGTDIRVEGDSSIDLTGATKLTFFAKAQPALSMMFIYVSSDITDFSYFRRPILIGTEWREYTVLMSPTTGLASPGWGQSMGKTPNFAAAKAFNFTLSKGANSSVTSGTLFLDDLKLHGWQPPSSVRPQARSRMSRALQAIAAGQDLKFRIPEAYRAVEGTLLATDLSGRTLAQASFAKGQEQVTLQVARTGAPVFFKVQTR